MRPEFHLIMVLLLAATVGAADSQEAKFSAEAEAAANRFRETALAEIKTLGNHPWGG